VNGLINLVANVFMAERQKMGLSVAPPAMPPIPVPLVPGSAMVLVGEDGQHILVVQIVLVISLAINMNMRRLASIVAEAHGQVVVIVLVVVTIALTIDIKKSIDMNAMVQVIVINLIIQILKIVEQHLILVQIYVQGGTTIHVLGEIAEHITPIPLALLTIIALEVLV